MKIDNPFFTRQRLFSGGWNERCKFYPTVMTDGQTMVMTWYMVPQAGGDVFYDNYFAISTDGGKTFGGPRLLTTPDTFTDGVRNHVTIISVYYNRTHKKWLVIGMETHYTADNVCVCHHGISMGDPVMAEFDPLAGDIVTPFRRIPVPVPYVTACPHGQILEDKDGDMLLSYYLTRKGETVSSAMTVRYTLTGDTLTVAQAGEVLFGGGYKRGFCEPSVACLQGKYYMTIRTDEQGLLAESDDGYAFTAPKPWVWDDGTVLENANTMQRWIRFRDSLWLVYTRKDAANKHVFRRRAPLYITKFDGENRCLVRSLERILVPELGADLGNFYVCDLSEREAILTTAETPMSDYSAQFGSDNSIWLVHLRDEGIESL